MSNLGAASGTLNSGTNDDNNTVGLGGGCKGTLNFGGEGASVLGMSSFDIKKDGMSNTLMSGTRKTTASGTTLTSYDDSHFNAAFAAAVDIATATAVAAAITIAFAAAIAAVLALSAAITVVVVAAIAAATAAAAAADAATITPSPLPPLSLLLQPLPTLLHL